MKFCHLTLYGIPERKFIFFKKDITIEIDKKIQKIYFVYVNAFNLKH